MMNKLGAFFDQLFAGVEDEETDEKSLKRAAAVLFLEVMHADHALLADEREMVLASMQALMEISEQEAIELFNEVEQLMQEPLSLHEFTSRINQHYSEQQKHRLLYWLWRVVFADGQMDSHEEHLMRRIADLLYISHSDYIRLRNSVQDSI